MSKEFFNKPVETLSYLLKTKQVSSYELTSAILEKAEKYNNQLNAYINITGEKALNMARKADEDIHKGNYKGMYHGIPIAIKDNVYINNEVTTMGSKIHDNFVPDYDATIVSKLKNAGAVFTGKLNMHEYAHGPTNNNLRFGECRNPWDVNRIPGSSSGGSGVATITSMAAATIGTDTGGSIRIPAASCGVVGFKPTHGRVSKHGVFPLAWSLDHVGPMTKTVKDAAGMLEVLAGYDQKDYSSLNVPVDSYTDEIDDDVKNLVVGINEEYFLEKVDSEIKQLVLNQIRDLEKIGVGVKTVNIPALKYAEYSLMTTMMAEPTAVHHNNIINSPEEFDKDVLSSLKLGELIPAVDYLQAQQYRNMVKDGFQKVFEEIDVLITPTTPFVAPFIGEDYGDVDGSKADLHDEVVRFTGPGNITGLPSLSIPCGFKDGIPVGLQIIGNAFEESTVLKVGRKIEKNVDFLSNVPDFDF